MLKPSEDRLNYSELLTPPPGFELDFAIGTTYTLDLEAMVGVPLALSLSEEMDQTFQEDPLYILEGLRRSSDQFAIFCEAGKIKVPYNQNAVFSMMENSIFEVSLENDRSFHPKIWLIAYWNKENEEVLYRLLVMSRNLTFDRSWDVAVALEGTLNDEKSTKNDPLIDFLDFLTDFTTEKEKRNQIRRIISKLPFIHFDPMNKHISDFEFCPLGIADYDKKNTKIFQKYHQMMIVSPFISEEIIKELNGQSLTNPRKVLITRKTELHKLTEDMLEDIEVYTLREAVIDGESAISEENSEDDPAQNQDIHAKIFARSKYNEHHIYLGSANSSTNAFNGNVEFLLKLKYKKRGFQIFNLLNDMFGDDENPFERIDTIPEQEETETDLTDQLQKAIKKLTKTSSHATAVQDDDELFKLKVIFEDLPTECHFKIGPLLSKRDLPLQKETHFKNLRLLELGSFYRVTAIKDDVEVSRIIKIHTEGIPDERDNEIFRSIIKDPYTFLKYVAFLLADDFLITALENFVQKNGAGKWDMDNEEQPPIYENMLKSASRSPEKLEDVETIIKIIESNDIIPNAFRHLHETFMNAVKKVKQ